MAKAIEQTPILEGVEAKRFLDILLANEKKVVLTEYEKKSKKDVIQATSCFKVIRLNHDPFYIIEHRYRFAIFTIQ